MDQQPSKLKRATGFFIFLAVMGGIGIIAYGTISKLIDGMQKQEAVMASSDAVQVDHTVRMALDSWTGNVIFQSGEFRRLLEAERIGLSITDDSADYVGRMQKMASGEYDVAPMTLDTYIQLGKKHDYSSVIGFVIDVSKGGDGVLGGNDVTIVGDLAKPGVKIALTPDTPSDFFISALAVHFDIPRLKTSGDWKVKTKGSEEAYKLLETGVVQAAVVWEPELTKGMNAGFNRVMTTADTHGLILDVLTLNRKFIIEKPDVAQAFIKSYFRALATYTINDEALAKEVSRQAGISPEQSKNILGGIELVGLNRNATYWMGVQSDDLRDLGISGNQLALSIDSCIAILNDTGKLDGNPFAGNYSTIILSRLITAAQANDGKTGNIFTSTGEQKRAGIAFKKLDDAGWAKLKQIGKLRVQPVIFGSGTNSLTLDGKKAVDTMAADLAKYPTFRAIVRGHTATTGDEAVNRTLSEERAASVANYLMRNHDIDPNRVMSQGVGGTDPLPQGTDESFRRWQGRLPRVEIILVEDPNI